MLQFICMGSGSSGNCYCLFTENDGLMIDAGLGIRTLKRSFKENGLSLSHIHHIIITHDHADHIKSVGSLSREFSLPVYATAKVHDGIERNFCVRNKVAPNLKRCFTKQVPLQVGDFMVTPFHVPHDSCDSVGYRISCQGIIFVLMTDVGHITDEMKEIISEANYLVIEANHDEDMLAQGPYPAHLKARIASQTGHLPNSECGRVLAENMTAELRHVWLCHLSEENNHPELARKTVEQILRSYGIVAGTDVQLDVLKRKSPSLLYQL